MRYVLCFVVALLFYFQGNAQVDASFQNLITVGTMPPEAASLGKFGNVPVSNCTGVPGITIPVYELHIGKIKLPISLDYHAGGIRVDEVSSSVGTGWALSGIGMISRTMVGLPDEQSDGYLGAPDPAQVVAAPPAYYQYVYGVSTKQYDAEPDIFQYSFNGQSGKFILKRDSSIMQIPVTNNRIVYDWATGNFSITDASGVQYIFTLKQNTMSSENTVPTYTSTWRISQMVDQNGMDTINFTYATACNVSYEQLVNFTYTIGVTGMGCGMVGQTGDITFAVGTADAGTSQAPAFMLFTHFDSYPQQITWRGGQINFVNTCDRQDVTGSGLRLNEVDVYANQNGVLNQVKRVVLYQSYFFSNPMINTTPTEKNYRLRLDSVGDLPIGTNDQPEVYRMLYNTGPMAPRESYAQDMWGFNNGQFSNGNLMPVQTQFYNGSYYTFGYANRNTDSASMLACTLQSIRYPTKGTSIFAFEPHEYNTQLPTVQQHTLQCAAYGGVQTTSSTTFTVGPNSYNYSYNVNITAFDYPDVTNRPNAVLTDLTTGDEVMTVSTEPTTATNLPYNTGTLALNITQGHTYQLTVNIYTLTDSVVDLVADINWADSLPGVPNIATGGGLRIKSVTNYDITGNFMNEDLYQYGDDGTGVILTPQYFQDINYEYVIHREGCPGGSFEPICMYFYENQLVPAPGYSQIYHANSVYPTSEYSGSPVLYRKVTKYQVDASGNPNGRTVFGYQVYQDSSTVSDQAIGAMSPLQFQRTGIYLISNNWENGALTSEEADQYVAGAFVHQSKKTYTYTPADSDFQNVLKLKPTYVQSGCAIPLSSTVQGDFTFYIVPIQTGAMLLTNELDTAWDNNGNTLATVRTISYNPELMPVVDQTYNSQGAVLTDNLKYSNDLAATGNVYQTMLNRNMVSPVVQDIRQNNGTQINLVNVNYNDWFGNGNLLTPQTVAVQTGSFPLENRVLFNQYDIYGNILDQQKLYDVRHAYIWDYKSVYPVAEVTGAARSDIAYTSFEADGSGNWTIPDLTRNSSTAMTGTNSYNLNSGNEITASGLNSATTYIVSYWSTGGSVNVSGTSGTAGTTVGAWTYYEHQVTGTATISVGGSATIDELRLFPKGALMTTYTYAPLIGMTSQCSQTNYVTYYNYDGLSRLASVKDMRGNIIKTYNYHYENQ